MSEQMLGQGPPNPAMVPEPDEWMRRLGALPLMHQPGEQWMYNTGSDVLGVLIARASGQPLEAFLRARIFDPLGMKDTGFHVPADKLDRFATGYLANPETGARTLFDEAAGGQWSSPPAFPSAAGGLVSTVDDYAAFGQMLLNHGKHGETRIISRPSVQLMTTDQLTAAQKARSTNFMGFWDHHGWGFGLEVATRRENIATAPGRYGWDGGLGTSWRSDPSEGMVCVLMTQCAVFPTLSGVYQDFWTSAYQAIDD
jgi:CubicO group peptidase (beta-lactamase class C family)